MNKKMSKSIILGFLTILVVSATIALSNAVISLLVTPMSGAPGDIVAVRSNLEGDLFEAQSTVGIGFGAEVAVVDETVALAYSGSNTPISGFTAVAPIKPGSFEWTINRGGIISTLTDNGDGTLSANTGFLPDTIINYTTGYFRRDTGETEWIFSWSNVTYTTYENDVTPAAGATVSGSGVLITTITVPPVPNGTYTITAFDEVGNVGTVNFQVVGSDIIPEPLTVGAIVLLSSTAMLVSFSWIRKKKLLKV